MKADTAKLREHLTTATFETFEKMFFIFLELSSRPAPAGYAAASSISFQGLLNGSMEILYSREFLDAMVCNLLSLKGEEITGLHRGDCAKEGINIVCGSFLAKLEGEKALDLSIPVFYPDLKEKGPGGEDCVILCFDSDNGSVEVRLAVRNES